MAVKIVHPITDPLSFNTFSLLSSQSKFERLGILHSIVAIVAISYIGRIRLTQIPISSSNMATGATACLQLGSAVIADPNSYAQVFTIKNSTDKITSSKKNDVPPSSVDRLDVVVNGSELQLPNIYNPMELATWVPLLSPSSVVSIQVLGGVTSMQPVTTSFLLAGLQCATERREADGSRILTATRKAMVPVSAAPLRGKEKNTAITVNLDFGVDDDDDNNLVDEDTLLEEGNLLAPPPAMSTQSEINDDDDCAGRKPCDNCSCGRAEREGRTETETRQSNGPNSSSCGKCTLGDAFRCASCPFLGKPAFKAGEEHVILNLMDDL